MNGPVIKLPLFGEGAAVNPPRGITIFGFTIYLYGLIIALGFGLAALYVYRRRGRFGLTGDNVLDIFLCAIAGGIIGARLYYIAFNPSEYFGAGKWLNIFKLREGGLAIFGGILLGGGAVAFYCRRKKLRLPSVLDAGALGLLIGQSVGRWGNFINREAYGSVTSLPWRMGLESPAGSGAFVFVHPTFLYESLWNALGFLLLHLFSRKRLSSKRHLNKRYEGQIFLLYALWYGVGRALIEGLRTDSLYIPGTPLRASQLLAAAAAVASLAALITLAVKHKTPAPSDGAPSEADIDYIGEEDPK
ncbi:MAG: prolipoprotein diacylglyceryl transferase [Oscillospiraceae bacterium]|jgi:phosphatidylglycerol:prolipoprotein diacylglycerol transferase|nr:prolipoprotein diacylglyceryl transferase [Oscillospiraceae bacterium]